MANARKQQINSLERMLLRERNPAHLRRVAKAESAELAVVSAQERLNRAIRTLEHAPSTGFTKDVESAVKEEADAKTDLQAAQVAHQKLRGDFI